MDRAKWGRARRAAFSVVVAAGALACLLARAAPAGAQLAAPRPWLGVAMQPQTGGTGVRIGHVVRGSPADRGGLREGDRIDRVGGIPVESGSDVIRAVAAHRIGDVLDVDFLRDGSRRSAHVPLASFPTEDQMARMDLVGAFAPPWTGLRAVNGALAPSATALRGRVVLVDFWATWCGPCRAFTSELGALQRHYGAQGFSVVGVSTENAQDVAAFAQRAAIPYPIAIDPGGETTRSYGVTSLPTVVLVDKRGVVRDVTIGYDGEEGARLDAAVRALLAEPAEPDAPSGAPAPSR